MLKYLEFVNKNSLNDKRPFSVKLSDERNKVAYRLYMKEYVKNLPIRNISRIPAIGGRPNVDSNPRVTIDLSRRKEIVTDPEMYNNNSKIYYNSYLNFINGMNKEKFRAAGYDVVKYPEVKEMYNLKSLVPYLERLNKGSFYEDSQAMFELLELYTNPYKIFLGKREKKRSVLDNIGYVRNFRGFISLGKVDIVYDKDLINYDSTIDLSTELFYTNQVGLSINHFHLNDMLYNDYQFLFKIFLYGYVNTLRQSQNRVSALSLITSKNYGNSIEEFYKNIDFNLFRQIRFLKSLEGDVYSDSELSSILTNLRGQQVLTNNILQNQSSSTVSPSDDIPDSKKLIYPEDAPKEDLDSVKQLFVITKMTATDFDFIGEGSIIYIEQGKFYTYVIRIGIEQKTGKKFFVCSAPAKASDKRAVEMKEKLYLDEVEKYKVVRFEKNIGASYTQLLMIEILLPFGKYAISYNQLWKSKLYQFRQGRISEMAYDGILERTNDYATKKNVIDKITPYTDSNGLVVENKTAVERTPALTSPLPSPLPRVQAPVSSSVNNLPSTPVPYLSSPLPATPIAPQPSTPIAPQPSTPIVPQPSTPVAQSTPVTPQQPQSLIQRGLDSITRSFGANALSNQNTGAGIEDTIGDFKTIFNPISFNNLGSCGNGQNLYIFTF